MNNLPDPETIIGAVRAALPTSRHAGMLFDAVVAGLAETGLVETANDRTILTLYRRDAGASDGVVPWPLLRLGTQGRLSVVVPLSHPEFEPVEAPVRPGRPPKLRNLGPAEVVLHDGAESITITYGEDGRWFESARTASIAAFARIPELLSANSANRVELLADAIAATELGRHGPARVHYPTPLPGGVVGAYRNGLAAIRRACFESEVPARAGWAVADGFAGSALAWGDTWEDAARAWEAEVEAHQPVPPTPAPVPDLPEPPDIAAIPDEATPLLSGHIVIRGPTSDVPWPEVAPPNTPAVFVPVAAPPPTDHTWGTCVRLFDAHGTTRFALLRQDPGGFTLVGEDVADRVELDELDDLLAGAVPLSTHSGVDQPAYDCHQSVYRLLDAETREPVPARIVRAHTGWGFDPGLLDGDELRWRVLQQRWS